jgi:hypothetical protein
MAVQQPNSVAQPQRVQVETVPGGGGSSVKIRMENYDEFLGWYTSGSLSLSAHQLPLLEQAIQEMRTRAHRDESVADKIIVFPGRLCEPSGHAK